MLRKGLQTFDGIYYALFQASKFDAQDFSSLRIVVCVRTYQVLVSFTDKPERTKEVN